MENKTWLWRRKSSEKTIVTSNKPPIPVKGSDEEAHKLPPSSGVGPVRPVRNLNEKLASVLFENPAKDVIEKEESAEEVVAGKEKVDAETVISKEEADEVVKHEVAATERIFVSDDASKQSTKQVSYMIEEQEKNIDDAVSKASSEFEKEKRKLEEKLLKMSKKLADVAIENANLTKALLLKEKLVEELHKRSSRTAAEVHTLMARLDSTEKENAFLKYEFHILEKELEVRNEELEYNRQSVDASHRQHLESAKKITRLEAECQRLRVLMRKRLPSPAAFGKIRREFEIPGTDRTELRKTANPVRDLVVRETTKEVPAMNTSFLTEQLHSMEEENKSLKDVMAKKSAELQFSRIMFSRTASRLSQVESQLLELSGRRKSLELSKYTSASKDLSLAKNHDNASDDGVSTSGSWANALMSELEHFRGRKEKTRSEEKAMKVSGIGLMDDFVEMEKLAIVSAEGESRNFLSGMEIVPADQEDSDITIDEPFDWLQDVLSAILKQHKISKRGMRELYEDVGIALGYVNHRTKLAESISTIVGSENMEEENTKLKDELKVSESLKKEMERKLREEEQNAEGLKAELKNLKEQMEMIEDHLENQKSINEDLVTQLTVTKSKLNEVSQKFSSLEIELEDKNICCEELEATCLELQLQLESVVKGGAPINGANEDRKPTGWEISAASAKLAECQETILNLGKQLKALASPRESVLFDKLISTSNQTTVIRSKALNKRFSLRDQLIAEDRAKSISLSSKEKEEPKTSSDQPDNANALSSTNVLVPSPGECKSSENRKGEAGVTSLAIVPGKRSGKGFLRRLLMRKKMKGPGKKQQIAGKE